MRVRRSLACAKNLLSKMESFSPVPIPKLTRLKLLFLKNVPNQLKNIGPVILHCSFTRIEKAILRTCTCFFPPEDSLIAPIEKFLVYDPCSDAVFEFDKKIPDDLIVSTCIGMVLN
jgi:hypothetical protein